MEKYLTIPQGVEASASTLRALNSYIYYILKCNGVKDADIGRRVFYAYEKEKPYYRHIYIDGRYYVTVAPTNYYDPTSHQLASESGFYTYVDSWEDANQKKIIEEIQKRSRV